MPAGNHFRNPIENQGTKAISSNPRIIATM
jgi:hypothetical protein